MEDASIIQEFAKYGIIGILFFLSLLALRSRDASYREVQEKRIEETKGNTERFLVAINANTETTKAAAEGFKTLAKSVEDMRAEMSATGRGGRR